MPASSAPPSPTPSGAPPPTRSTGTFSAAPGTTARVGAGQLIDYRVEVENGSGQDPAGFAAEVDAILANPDGWTADRRWSLRRVSGPQADLVIRLATPPTVDRICATVGLDTAGYASCRAGPYAMINLTRWLEAVPEYRGDIALYRRYVINHEVGHRLGHGHELCPGRGRLAPVMQQQTYGLRGCQPNGWPYLDGRYIQGPSSNQN